MLMVGGKWGVIMVGAVCAARRGSIVVMSVLQDCGISDLRRYHQRIGVPRPGQHKGHSQSHNHGR